MAPYIVLSKSAPTKGIARKYGNYRRVAVVKTDGNTVPKMISERARGLVEIVVVWNSCNVGKTANCRYARRMENANNIAQVLNYIHDAKNGGAPITLNMIKNQDNAELQQMLIEAYGGLDAYLRDSCAEVVQQDHAGTLLRLPQRGGEPLVAVAVRCPSTGREYVLRVPPEMKTAREAVAWTFDTPCASYVPVVQS